MKVTVIGSGYVGLVAAAAFAEIGHDVFCCDNDRAKVGALRAGHIPIYEKHLELLVQRHFGCGLQFELVGPEPIRRADVIVIAVGTPAQAGRADLSQLHAAVETIAGSLRGVVFQQKIVLQKSTVPVGTGKELARRLPRRVELVANPEFLREGTAVTDFLYPDRVVAGAENGFLLERIRALYAPILDGSYAWQPDAIECPRTEAVIPQWIPTNMASAEMIKLASNAFLATKVSFINSIAAISEATGADIEDVARGMGADPRIGDEFLQAGIGYGGSCFPKDLGMLQAVAEEAGLDFDLLAEVERINVDQRYRFIEKLRDAVGSLRGKRMTAFGISFKPGTDDVRESPALDIVRALIHEGCEVTVCDPVANQSLRKTAEQLHTVPDPYVAAQNTDAVLVLTAWPEFAQLDLTRLRAVMRAPLIVDGRNIFDANVMRELGFTYLSVGRTVVLPARRVTGTAG